MLKKPMTYTDYNGDERTEIFLFNLTKAEVMEMELEIAGGMKQKLEKIIAEKDSPRIIEHFKDIILRSYGEKSPDGKRFIKSPELTAAFSQTEAFSDLFVELSTNSDSAAAFINGIIPQSLLDASADVPKLGVVKKPATPVPPFQD